MASVSRALQMLERLARRAEGDFPIQCPLTFSKRVLSVQGRFVDRRPLMTTLFLSASVIDSLERWSSCW